MTGHRRIVHALTHDRVERGGAFQALLLAREQARRGHRVVVIANERRGRPLHPSFRRWVSEGLEVRHFDMGRPSEIARFAGFLRSFAPDVVHGHRNDALAFVTFASFLAPRSRRFAHVFQRGTTKPPQHFWVGHMLRSSRVHRIVAVARAVRDSLVRHGVPTEKVRVIYGSYDEDRFDPSRVDGVRVRAELGLGPAVPLVVQAGKLNGRKSPETLVRAASFLVRRLPDLVVAFAGGGGDRREVVERLVAELGLERNVRLLGFRDDLPDVYAAADVVVNASRDDEGLTGALREALALERPVVSTRVSGNPELVEDGVTGLLVPPRDPTALAHALGRLLSDREAAAAMARRGRARVRERMTNRVRADAVERLYGEALAGL